MHIRTTPLKAQNGFDHPRLPSNWHEEWAS